MSHRKPPAPTKEATNIGLDPELKTKGIAWLAKMNSSLSKFVEEALEVHLIAAGEMKPRKPLVQVVPELLKKK